ncbi:hypothetical protein PR048_020476 [Dryococelus australis]|uniref:Uncharacterized protein n=1 Tax=Dryococelus australis TaxID=614101 RepID=A0ABQ9H6D0_9NEOP|nr:hypothetical protein PR048_020476 [Dryococelus australis]
MTSKKTVFNNLWLDATVNPEFAMCVYKHFSSVTWDGEQLSRTLKVQNIWNLCKLKFHNHFCLNFVLQKVIQNNHLCLDVVDILL